MDRDDEHIERSVKVMKKSGKLWIALTGVALGVLLLIFGGDFSNLFGGKGDTEQSPDEITDGPDRMSMESYRTAIEARVCDICSRVDGVGKVYAVVNLAGGFEYVYATDIKNSSGGASSQYIVIGSGDNERVVYLSEKVPEILGIGVVCEGGGDIEVKKEVTALLCAAFGLGSHKIYVTGGA